MAKRLVEVAEYAGVSEATVSRVLNGKPGVAESTRAAVLSACDVLGYERPRQLRERGNRLVGLVAPDLTNPVFPAFSEVIGSTLAQRGFTPVLCTRTFGGVSESDYVDLLLEHQISGAVFVCGLHSHIKADHSHYERLLERGLPVIGVNGMAEGLSFPSVSTDDGMAAELAVRHRLPWGTGASGWRWGSTTIMCPPSARRRRSSRRCASSAACGTPSRSSHTRCTRWRAVPRPRKDSFSRASRPWCPAATSWLSVPSGRSSAWDSTCRATSPSVGYDDSTFMPLANPPLTTLRQPVESMGRAAVSLLASRIAGKSTATATRSSCSSPNWWCGAAPRSRAVRACFRSPSPELRLGNLPHPATPGTRTRDVVGVEPKYVQYEGDPPPVRLHAPDAAGPALRADGATSETRPSGVSGGSTHQKRRRRPPGRRLLHGSDRRMTAACIRKC